MTTSNLEFGTDGQGRNAYAPNVSNLKYQANLAQNVASSITIPSDPGVKHYIVAFGYAQNSNVYVDFSGIPAVAPSNTTFQVSTVEYLPGQRTVPAGSSISVVTPDSTGARVEILIYAKQP